MIIETFLKSLVICVIAVDESPRSKNLLEDISQIFPSSDIRLVKAITPHDMEENLLENLKEQSAILLGRIIGSKEIAVLMSHRKCYETFLSLNQKYLLVLEDDVILQSRLFDPKVISNHLNRQKPTILSLYSPLWSIWKKSRAGVRAKFPPACAAAYYINVQAAKLAVNTYPIGIADWPPWAHSVDFFLEKFLDVTLIDGKSFLQEQRELDKGFRSRRVVFKRTPQTIRKIWQVRYIIIYPLYWKLYKILRKSFYNDYSDTRFIRGA